MGPDLVGDWICSHVARRKSDIVDKAYFNVYCVERKKSWWIRWYDFGVRDGGDNVVNDDDDGCCFLLLRYVSVYCFECVHVRVHVRCCGCSC